MDEIKQSLGLPTTVVETSHTEAIKKGFKPMGQVRGRSIPETKELILQGIKEADRSLNFNEICAYLDRKKTPHLRQLLHAMADAGQLVETVEVATSAMLPRFWYSLP
jgi:predicted MarR family transcription regulator